MRCQMIYKNIILIYIMDYFYERNIVEIKNEYTIFLTNIITPFVYEGIRSVYGFALNAHNEFLEKGKNDPDVKSPGILKLFQISLKEIPTLNNHSIEDEVNRIKSGSKCADWFDDLVRAVIKSNIVLLTFNNPKKRPALLKEEYHNKIEIKDFLHKCYIESARLIYNNPELYWHEFSPLEIKRNQREACDLIKQAIHEAIRKMLPIKLILKEYLTNDYYDDENDVANRISNSDYMNIHNMVKRDLHGIPVPGREKVPIDCALESDDTDRSEQSGGERSEKEEDYTRSSPSSTSPNRNYGEYESKEGGTGLPEDDELNKIRKSFEALGQTNIPNQTPEPTNIPSNRIPKQDDDQYGGELEKMETIKEILQQESGVPRAANDAEIQKLLEQSQYVNHIEKKKKKLSKKEEILIDELQANMKPTEAEPDRKLFFEQYMK
jgi:hypothetical protein